MTTFISTVLRIKVKSKKILQILPKVFLEITKTGIKVKAKDRAETVLKVISQFLKIGNTNDEIKGYIGGQAG